MVEAGGSRPGFTIIELLIVIGVVLVIGAISLPFTLGQFERRTETEATDRLGLLVRFARAESRSSGVPIEVRCDASGRIISAYRIDPRDPGSFEVGKGGFEEDRDPDRRLSASWAVVELPGGLAIEPAPEDEDLRLEDDFSLEFGERTRIETEPVIDPWPESTRILLMIPDGTVIVVEEFGIRSGRGWRRCRIDSWTALSIFDSVGSPGNDLSTADDGGDREPPDPESGPITGSDFPTIPEPGVEE